eukprot:TRINITY_DN10891_c0_g1_i2.p2 TRINITY_DN10891_c0_g1~~TRINITY_DN10891_c0_g1_i2.p2  ORF type:complete len:164 (-),score=17.20 TRINITY_DN10891_c0_g1_i2:2547-2987(-)
MAELAVAEGVFVLAITCALYYCCCCSTKEHESGNPLDYEPAEGRYIAFIITAILVFSGLIAINAVMVHYVYSEELLYTCSKRVANAIGALAATNVTLFALCLIAFSCLIANGTTFSLCWKLTDEAKAERRARKQIAGFEIEGECQV